MMGIPNGMFTMIILSPLFLIPSLHVTFFMPTAGSIHIAGAGTFWVHINIQPGWRLYSSDHQGLFGNVNPNLNLFLPSFPSSD